MTRAGNLQESWQLLEEQTVASSGLRVREILEIAFGSEHPLIALDSEGQRHVLIPVASSKRMREDRRSSGVQIVTQPLLDGDVRRVFIDVVCRKPHLHELFAVVVSEMLDQLKVDASSPDLTCIAVLERWRELLEKELSGRPTMETLTGLFGELWHLREIVRLGSEGLRCWTGPTGARHDFSGGQIGLEVKATLRRHGRFFEIHGHEQLEALPGGQLYLGTLNLEHLPGSGESVPELVTSIATAGGDHHALLTRISAMGILPADLEQTRDVTFRVVEHRMYVVDDTFPRIVAASFNDGRLPSGVLRISYQIDLTTQPPDPLPEEDIPGIYAALIAGATI